MRSSDLTVLVTGANGFIGRHLILELLNRGYAVIAGVREASNVQRIQDLPVEIVRLNYLDQDSLRDKLQETRPDFIIHNAGITVGKQETDYFLGNTESTRNLLKASTEIGLSKFVYISSLAARGPGKNPQDSPVSPYGKSKLEAETAVRLSGIDFTIIRPTAVYGPGDSAFDPIFAWANRGVILQLGSASRKLTFIHVSDLSRIIADSLHSGEVLHYGWDGRNYIQRDFTNALRKATGKRG
ncbi:MAG: NAD(P)-dependent oxidoreductase, partial [Cyclobacteriaceae bacterium]